MDTERYLCKNPGLTFKTRFFVEVSFVIMTPTSSLYVHFYFGGARSKGFATLRNASKLQFFDKIGQAKSVGFRLYSAI